MQKIIALILAFALAWLDISALEWIYKKSQKGNAVLWGLAVCTIQIYLLSAIGIFGALSF